MPRTRTQRAFAILCVQALFLLPSCTNMGITVDDLGDRWQSGVIDPQLLGTWRAVADEDQDEQPTYRFSDRDGRYFIESVDGKEKQDVLKETVARTTLVGPHRFFMSGSGENDKPKATARPGSLLFYTVEDGVLTFWTPKEGLLKRAVEEEEVSGHVTSVKNEDGRAVAEMVSLERLDANTLAFLEALARDPANWTVLMRFKRLASDP